MPHEFFWPVFGVLFILALLGMGMIGSHLSASRRMQLRAIQKEERMKAIEAGVPLPEVDEPIGAMTSFVESDEKFARRVEWLKMVSQALGFLLLFSGLGIYVGFTLVMDRELQEIAAIGFLPALAGIGLLLFYWVNRHRKQ